MVDHLGCKTCCFCKNVIGGRHGNRYEEVNESKYLWYAISLLLFLLDYFASPYPEMQRFVYYGIRQEYHEGLPCSSPLGGASAAEYR